MSFDYKKEYKEYYQPGKDPEIAEFAPVRYIAVRGAGNPNEPEGEYARAISILYAVAFTLKMSPKCAYVMEGYFDYVVPPLEGFWWQQGVDGMDYAKKDRFQWISAIRLPEFVSKADFDWATARATEKKKLDCSKAEFLTLTEGLCVQMTHTGRFDDEPASVARMDAYIRGLGYENDFTDGRLHHEIYMSDPRKCAPERQKTVIRHPIRKIAP